MPYSTFGFAEEQVLMRDSALGLMARVLPPHKFADMRMLSETARLVTYRCAEMLDAGEDAVTETAIAKVVASENNFKVADMGMQVMGAAGYVQGDMQRLFREARLGMIGGGTSEILRNVIANRMDI